MKKYGKNFTPAIYLAFVGVCLAVFFLCICCGSVSVPIRRTLQIIYDAIFKGGSEDPAASIILLVRIPRVICTALTGAALSLSGAAMQGLLKNPLADGSTLGVSSGASLGAVLAIALGISLPGLPLTGTAILAMLFAFLSMAAVITLAYKLDRSLSTNTIVLIGVIFSMFISSIINLVISLAGEKVKSITFWTMGSLQGSSYKSAALLGIALLIFGGAILSRARELNAFAIGEENARNVGVDVRRVKLLLLICVSALTGVCVSVGGGIGFVGLVTPHMTRMIVGPNNKKLLVSCLFSGAVFLMLSDLAARVLLRPTELPIGVITSFIGAIVFVCIFYSSRRVN